VPIDGWIFLVSAGVAALIASIGIRNVAEDRPGWAVRVYLGLFSAARSSMAQPSTGKRVSFPRREAFLATWFLVFFVLFLMGNFIAQR
jgi:hypothetical protein